MIMATRLAYSSCCEKAFYGPAQLWPRGFFINDKETPENRCNKEPGACWSLKALDLKK